MVMSLVKEKEYLLEGECLDFKKELRLSGLLKLFQDIALEHVEELYKEDDDIEKKGLHWVVARYHVLIKRNPHLHERIKIMTYPSHCKVFFFPREFIVFDEKGEIIIQASSLWALVDEEKRSMVKPSDYNLADLGYKRGDELIYPLSFKCEGGNNAHTFFASYSLCDVNNHLNNCSYIDVAMDALPIDYLKSHNVKSLDIQYKKEIPLGTLSSFSYSLNQDYYSANSDNFSLGIEFEDKDSTIQK